MYDLEKSDALLARKQYIAILCKMNEVYKFRAAVNKILAASSLNQVITRR